MKKIIFVLLAICSLLTACSKTNATWDCVEYTNLEEMNKAANTNIVDVDIEKTDQWYGVISESIAQYKFKIADEEWCVRASKDVDNDISGLYYDNIGFEKGTTSFYYLDEVYMCRFFYDDTQYVISLDVKDKDISTMNFDDICNQFKTNITGIKSGYESEVYEDGDDVVFKTTTYVDDGTTIISESIYSFEDDKMVSYISKLTFESEEKAKEYYDLLIENGRSADELILDESTITTDMSSNIDFYSNYTKEGFYTEMKNSITNN